MAQITGEVLPPIRHATSTHDWFGNPAHDIEMYGPLSFAEANDYRILRECIEKHLPYFEDDVAEVAIWCQAVEDVAAENARLKAALAPFAVQWSGRSREVFASLPDHTQVRCDATVAMMNALLDAMPEEGDDE